jgi:hypothetical protein
MPAPASPGPGAWPVKLSAVRTRNRSVMPLLLALLAAPSVLTGCGGGAADQQSASSGPIETSSAAASSTAAGSTGDAAVAADGATDAPAFPANAEPDTANASPESQVTVRDVRLGRQDGFDRVVFEVGGTGTPGWNVRYVHEAASQGSGKKIDVAGNAILQVSLTGIGYPYDTDVAEYSADRPLTAAGTTSVTEVVYDATFEGTAEAFVGTRSEAPFRVYLLQNPTRVVVEVADPS